MEPQDCTFSTIKTVVGKTVSKGVGGDPPAHGGATDRHLTNVDLLNQETKTVVAILGHG